MDNNPVTDKKVKHLVDRGFDVTGYILTNPITNTRAFIEHGRVQWYDLDEAAVILGHQPKPALTEGKTKSNIKVPTGGKRPVNPPPIPRPKNDQKD